MGGIADQRRRPVTAPYAVLSRPCIEALPTRQGDPVPVDALTLHASCDGT